MLLLRSNIPINLSAIGCLNYIMVVLCIFAALCLGFCNFSEPQKDSIYHGDGVVVSRYNYPIDFPFTESHGESSVKITCWNEGQNDGEKGGCFSGTGVCIFPQSDPSGLIFSIKKVSSKDYIAICYNPMLYSIDPLPISFTLKSCDQ